MADQTPHCSLGYHKYGYPEVETFAHGVSTGIYTHPAAFPAPPLAQPTFDALVAEYHSKYEAYKNGGKNQKGDFLTAKANLFTALDNTAEYVDELPGVNDDLIILAGYLPTKTGDSEGTKPGQCVVTVKRGITGELVATCAVVPGAKHYGCIVVVGAPLPEWLTINAEGRIVIGAGNFPPPPPADAADAAAEPDLRGIVLDLTDQREKHFTGLKHDEIYYFYYYAVNATGVGPLSEAVSMVAW